jgi:hypothetical protein
MTPDDRFHGARVGRDHLSRARRLLTRVASALPWPGAMFRFRDARLGNPLRADQREERSRGTCKHPVAAGDEPKRAMA